jgi:hypothetical protein
MDIQKLLHPRFSLDFAQVDFLISKVKEELAGLHMSQKSLKDTSARLIKG